MLLRRWKFKVAVQFILANLPMGERLNYVMQKLGNRHSSAAHAAMIEDYAKRIAMIDKHVPLAGATVVLQPQIPLGAVELAAHDRQIPPNLCIRCERPTTSRGRFAQVSTLVRVR